MINSCTSDSEEDSVNFMPLLNQTDLEDELSPIDSISLDIGTIAIYFEMSQIIPSKRLKSIL